MMNDVKTDDGKVKKLIWEQSTGRIIEMPPFVSFCAYASTVILRPVFWVPTIVVNAMIIYFIGFKEICSMSLLSLTWLILVAMCGIMNLEERGIHKELLSYMFHEFTIPKSLFKLFGKLKESDL